MKSEKMLRRINAQIPHLFAFLCLVSIVNANMKTSQFHKLQNTTGVKLENSTSVQAASRIECSMKCASQDCDCYSFDKQLRSCEIGVCIKSTIVTYTTKDFYVSCNEDKGFKYLTYGSVSACVWKSTDYVDFPTARYNCKGLGAKLYTIKNLEKLKLLETYYYGVSMWIGLSETDGDEAFRWEDDNTICDTTCVTNLFATGKPDSGSCAYFFYIEPRLDDDICNVPFYYICEKSVFNFF